MCNYGDIQLRLHRLNREIITCKKCPRLVKYREEVARKKRKAYRNEKYWGKPVPSFGDPLARVLVVGLAPAAHGANRTGRMFTGDRSGEWLYRALYKQGFANQPYSLSQDDGLLLRDVYVTAVVRCVPPKNKPSSLEINNCLPFLEREIVTLCNLRIFLALGRIAFDGLKRVLQRTGFKSGDDKKLNFKHGALYELFDEKGSRYYLKLSYHPSQQNTQTGRLTEEMFDSVFRDIRSLLEIKS